MIRIEKGTQLHTVYESLDDFEKEAPRLYNLFNAASARSNVFDKFDRYGSWFGAPSGQIAMEKVRAGWPEMLQKLMQMWDRDPPELLLQSSKVKVRRRKRVRSDYGDTLDMTRVWGGDLDHAWQRPERLYRLSASQRHATIFIDLGTRCNEGADSVLWRGVAALQICDLLQRAGRSVEIYVGSSMHDAYLNGPIKQAWSAIRVKAYTQPLAPEYLAAMVTMAFFRTYGFLMIAASGYKVSESYGYPSNKGLPLPLQERQDAGELVVRLGHCNSKERAEAEFDLVKNALSRDDVAEESAA